MALYTPPLDLEGQPLAVPHQRAKDASNDQDYHDDTFRRVTPHQLFYILVPQGVGAAIIDAVANFAIACAMYRTTHKEIRLWPLNKNTIAGDMGLTVIIQGILTTLITCALVRKDVRAGRIEPFGFPWPLGEWQQEAEGRSWWRCRIGRALNFLSPTQTLSLRAGRRHFAQSLFLVLMRGFAISALYFILFWPLAIAITAPLYGGIDMRGTWIPEFIKAVFGGVLGLFMNPFVAALVLGTCSVPSQSCPAPKQIMSTTCIAPPIPPESHMQQVPVLGPSLTRPVAAHISPRS